MHINSIIFQHRSTTWIIYDKTQPYETSTCVRESHKENTNETRRHKKKTTTLFLNVIIQT